MWDRWNTNDLRYGKTETWTKIWGNWPDQTANSVLLKVLHFLDYQKPNSLCRKRQCHLQKKSYAAVMQHKATRIPVRLVEQECFGFLIRFTRAVAHVFRFIENLKRKIMWQYGFFDSIYCRVSTFIRDGTITKTFETDITEQKQRLCQICSVLD